MSTKLEALKALVRELIKKELDEASVTGNLDGGAGPPKTPFAFKKKKKDESISEVKFHVKTEMGSVLVDASGKGEAVMKVAKALKGGRKGIISVNRVGVSQAKQVDQKIENVTEGKYHDYRNDESLTPKQKIGMSMREVRDKLNELDKLVKMNVRFKNEVGVDSTSYWKNTHNAMKKISERLVKLANKVGQLY
ncbi:hypothetical protein HOE22_05525 [Candidatus Woesearchaeota archaeon]|jgi:hypothetical protein|nr:hypothetical protein [Candidatus Woesearchaeota archaeon]MBT4731832.1 hypothetical protein [Candidatus Woesearchaeota archaeon]MBT7556517.1 hypothetical protein [Candidatus Woesearchaeota archaeon]